MYRTAPAGPLPLAAQGLTLWVMLGDGNLKPFGAFEHTFGNLENFRNFQNAFGSLKNF